MQCRNTHMLLMKNYLQKNLTICLLAFLITLCSSVNAQYSNITITTNATSGGSFSGGVFTPTANNANIQASALVTQLTSNTTTTINTACASCTQPGNVTISTAVTAARNSATAATFNINAGGSITISSAVNLTASNSGGTAGTGRPGISVNFTAASTLSVSAAITTTGNVRGTATAGAGGNIILTSTAANIFVGGVLTANGATAVSGSGGAAGDITLSALTGIRITQNISANGGNRTTSGNGGAGGDLIIDNDAVAITTGGGINDGQTAGVISLAAGTGGTPGAVGTLSKTGSGTLILAGANTYTGATTITAGALRIKNATGTGTTAGGVTVSSGAALELDGTITVGAEALSLNNTGVSSGGALRNISGTNTWGGAITLLSNDVLINSDGGTLTLSGNISNGAIDLTFGGAGNTTVSGVIGNGAGTITKEGVGTLTLSNTNTYTGLTSINGGVVSVGSIGNGGSSGNLGATAAATGIALGGGTLLYSGATASTNRIISLTGSASSTIQISTGATTLTLNGNISGTTAAITKSGAGTLAFGAIAATFSDFTISAGTLNAGPSTINLIGNFTNNSTFTGGTSTLNFNGTNNQSFEPGTSQTYNIVKINNASGVVLGAATTITTLTIGDVTANSIFTDDGNQITSGGTLNLTSGTFTLGATSATTFPSFTTRNINANSTVEYAADATQSVSSSPSYGILKISGSGTKNAPGNISVATQLEIVNGSVLDMGTNQLSGATLTTSGTGILKTSNTGNTPIPSGRNWTMDIQFVASSNQNVPAGTYSKTLSIQGSNTAKLMNGNITVNTLDLTSGSIVLNDINGTPYTLTVTSQIIRAISGGTIDGVNDGVLEFANNAALLDIPQGTFGVGGINNMKISGGRTVRLASDYNGNLSLETLTTTGAGSYFDMNGYTLTITNSVSMSSGNGITGSLKGGSAPITGSSLIIGGVANQANIGTLYFDQTTPDVTNSFYNLTIGTTGGGSVTLGNKMNIRNTLQPPTSGTFTFNADSNLVIASRSTYTGRIAQINSGFSFGGKVIVERYVKNKTARRYIFLASPVDGISIRNGWQDDIFITSPASGGTACATDSTNGIPNKYNTNGYDATTRKLVTIFTYNQADKKWDSVITKSDSTYLQKGVGYRVYYRGSRGLNDANCSTMLESNSPIAPDSTIMDVEGTPTSGNVTVGVYGKGSNATYGYTLVGNPYPSELNFEVFQSDPSNSSIVSPTYWTHDPQSSSTTGYLSYNNNSVAGGASKTSGVITGANGKYIASGQAFFVQSALSGNANAGSITFKETHKSSSQQLGVFRNANTPLTWESRIRIGFLEADSTAVDDVLVRFSDEASVTKAPSDFWDAPTLNATKYLGTIKSNRTFAIQTRPKNFVNDTVMVRIVSNTTGNHILSFSEFDDFTEAAQIILIDQFTGIKTDVRANKYYPFTITNSAASQGGRFLLVFRSKESVMPVSFMNISATQKQEGVEVSWKVAYEQNVQDYSVERSDNGRDFKVIATVLSKGNSNAPVAYTYIDLQPLNGKGYYRVKSNEKSGETKYTAVVMVNSSKETLISVYPNPAKDNLQVQVSNPEMYKRVTILVRNAQGKTVIQQTAATVNGKVSINVSSLATGMYVISIINDKGESLMDKFVKQ